MQNNYERDRLKMSAKWQILIIFLFVFAACFPAFSDEEKKEQPAQKQQDAKGLDMVSDTVSSVLNKANALLTGNLEITMSGDKADTEDLYTRNAIGQKVPRTTAVKAAGALHNDEPL